MVASRRRRRPMPVYTADRPSISDRAYKYYNNVYTANCTVRLIGFGGINSRRLLAAPPVYITHVYPLDPNANLMSPGETALRPWTEREVNKRLYIGK